MANIFPSQEWLDNLIEYINQDEKYAKIAAKWEGDILFDILPAGGLTKPTQIYLDLWHGKCRGGKLIESDNKQEAAFILRATYDNLVRVLSGDLDPMQAMLTRKLSVKGSMAYMMRNVPTVLEFVRCAKDVTDEVLS